MRLAEALAILVLTACAATSRQGASRPPAASIAPEAVGPACEEARAVLQRDEFAQGAALLQPVVDAKGLEAASAADRHCVLLLRGYAAFRMKDLATAMAFLRRSSAMEQATRWDWELRLETAGRLRLPAEAIASLTAIARSWPEVLSEHDPDTIFTLVGDAKKLQDQTLRFDLLESLFDAKWKPDGSEPSGLWKDLAAVFLERGAPERAAEVATRIKAPRALIAMRADRRFDAIVQGDPARFDAERAQAAEIEEHRTAVAESPRSLRRLLELADSLSASLRYQEVVTLMDEALARAEADGGPAYDDGERRLVWVRDTRSGALQRLGRWDEAVEELERARKMAERGKKNASQSINLASLYCALDRPKDALATLEGLPEVSEYGRMQLEYVRLKAALALRDDAGAARSLGWLLEHREDSVSTAQAALLLIGDVEAAAGMMVWRLEDRSKRSDALYAVQDFPESAHTPRQREMNARWTAMIARPEVQAAIAKFGRIERYSIAP